MNADRYRARVNENVVALSLLAKAAREVSDSDLENLVSETPDVADSILQDLDFPKPQRVRSGEAAKDIVESMPVLWKERIRQIVLTKGTNRAARRACAAVLRQYATWLRKNERRDRARVRAREEKELAATRLQDRRFEARYGGVESF